MINKLFKKEFNRSRNKCKYLLVNMIKKSYKKGWPNYKEELELLRSVELVKSKLVKLKIEFRMLYVLLELLLMKELLLEVVVHC